MDPEVKARLAVDLDPRNRPGVPMEREPHPETGAHSAPIPQQHSLVKVFRHGRPNKAMPPVYGTAQPPSGLSGLLRSLAYRYPDHYARHWTMLLLADRVNVWERRIRRLAVVAGIGGLVWAAARIYQRAQKKT